MEKYKVVYSTTDIPNRVARTMKEEGFEISRGWIKALDNFEYAGKLIYRKDKEAEVKGQSAIGSLETKVKDKTEEGKIMINIFLREDGSDKLDAFAKKYNP